ncbi:hypothetical protein T01_6280 [Trichinella spiralis]|uniref:Uncharacterized protein n=1 Tax=Trichinella spiralis TaxID=6334 RepID=A0A0V0Z1B2_TRISP|nr:hypothetical protein T01_6280 [Trichinella spiralis]
MLGIQRNYSISNLRKPVFNATAQCLSFMQIGPFEN